MLRDFKDHLTYDAFEYREREREREKKKRKAEGHIQIDRQIKRKHTQIDTEVRYLS